jgi:hypothetical protein
MMRRSFFFGSLCLALGIFGAAGLLGSEFETIRGVNLTGGSFMLTKTAQERPSILLIGFSRASGESILALEDALWADPGIVKKANVTTLLQLQDAPSFVLPLILRGLRKQRPKERWPSVWAVREGKAELEILAGYDERYTDEVYAVVLDRQGVVLRRIRGKPASVEQTLRAVLP